MTTYQHSQFAPPWTTSQNNSMSSKNAALMWIGSHFVLFHVMFLFAYQNYSANPISGVILSLSDFYGAYISSHILMIGVVLLATPCVSWIVDQIASRELCHSLSMLSLPRMAKSKTEKIPADIQAFEEDKELRKIEEALIKLAAEHRVHMPSSKMRETLVQSEEEESFQADWSQLMKTMSTR